MQLLGFNVGPVQTQLIDGESVQTAYIKTAAPQPWVITERGAGGDQVAVHPDHLYAFDRSSYDYWADELNVDPAGWPDGFFAENLTLDTIDSSQLRVGDIYELGSATLVVTGPRVPCWKLTWRLKQPKTFIRRFRLSGHSGVYLGVIEPGICAPGDTFQLVSSDPTSPTIADLSQVADSGTRITCDQRELIDRALASPHLSETVRMVLSLKTANLDRVGADGAGVWQGWRSFEVAEATPESADATSFVLRANDAGELAPFKAGQHVVVRLTERGGAPFVRTWSLSEYQLTPDRYRITVKHHPNGRGGAALAKAPSRGLKLELRAPAGRFCLDSGGFRPVVLIAAGIGITPMISMIEAHLNRAVGKPPLWLLYGTAGPESTAFRGYLNDLFARHDDMQLHYFYSRICGEEPAATVHRGRISSERVISLLREGNYILTPQERVSVPWFECDVYICGPREFNAEIHDELVAAGANPDLVMFEGFVAAQSEATVPSRHRDARVTYASVGLTAKWLSSDERTLLELAEDHGYELPHDCRSGTCRTCESVLVSGDVDGQVTTTSDGRRLVLLCSSYPRSDDVVVDPPLE